MAIVNESQLNFPSELQTEQQLYQKLIACIRSKVFEGPHSRIFENEICYILKMLENNPDGMHGILYKFGILIPSSSIFAININTASRVFKFNKQSIRNWCRKFKSLDISKDDKNIPQAIQEIINIRQWKIFQLKNDNSIYKQIEKMEIPPLKNTSELYFVTSTIFTQLL